MGKINHGYSKHSIEDIRRILIEEFNITDEKILGQTKVPLINVLLELKKEQELDKKTEELSQRLENMSEEDDEAEEEYEDSIDNEYVGFYSPAWSDYVLTLFSESELVDGHPTCDGCRRLVNFLIGPIIESGIAQIIPATEENGKTSTVVFQIKVLVNNDDHPLYQKVIHMEDVADCNKYNTDAPYNKYLSAMASTRAEGRILRKILGLKTIVAEEKSDKENEEELNDSWSVSEKTMIEPSQEICINVMCKRNNLNVLDYINSGQNKYTSMKEIPYDTAQLMIQELNNIQRGIKEKPQSVGDYEDNDK